MADEQSEWIDVGSVAELSASAVTEVRAGSRRVALVFREGRFTAIAGECNHVGGPLGQGRLDGDYVVCPWHNWKFHAETGEGEPGFEEDRVPTYAVEVRGERVLVDPRPRGKRTKKPHAPHPLATLRPRGSKGGPPADGPLHVLGISTTAMDTKNPRPSTSEILLETALAHAVTKGADTRMIRVRELSFRSCEGYYSKSARACTWPCSITQMDEADQMDRVYEGVVQWADVILVATPIRWGSASSLYYKMAERMNCIQNQITIADRVLMKNKVASFIVTGGQDNVQAVVGQMLTFFGELGCAFPQFPFVGHSRGWSAEDMERNVSYVQKNPELHEGTRELCERAMDLAHILIEHPLLHARLARGGRKAHALPILEE